MNVESAFFQRSSRVAQKFLQTAVVIDDRAFRPGSAVPELPVVQLTPPPTPMTVEPIAASSATIAESTTAVEEQAAEPPKDPDPHGIDAEVVIESFAQHGIVCSVLRREANGNLTSSIDRVHQLLLIADILILDWQVHHPDGSDSFEGTLRFLESAVRKSIQDTPQQLRLIVIYTGANDLLRVAEKIGECLKSAAGKEPSKDGDFAFRTNAMRIVVLGKPSNYRATDQRNQQVDDDSDLCARVIQEFAVMTAGLVSNVVLESLAQVRRATHGILARFGQELDAPFLAHRALLNPPTEGNDHLIPLIVSEIEAILEDQVSRDLLSDNSISEWLASRPAPTLPVDSAPEINTIEKEQQAVRDICLKGVHQHASFSLPSQPSWLKKLADNRGVTELGKLTNVIAGKTTNAANEALEVLMSLRSHYSTSPPMLALGTLLSSEVRDEKQTAASENITANAPSMNDSDVQTMAYWLCLQPICDCYIRDECSLWRPFPLLRLDLKAERFNLVAEGPSGILRLRWDAKPYKVKMFEFEAKSATQTVLATREGDAFWFQSPDSDTRFRWLGQLKFPQAQRVAQSLSSETGRVGLTESEWLRRSAK